MSGRKPTTGRFATLPPLGTPFTILAVSCNNIDADKDSSFIEQLMGRGDVANRLGTIHMGTRWSCCPRLNEADLAVHR